MSEGVFDQRLGVWRYDITEGTAAAESLKAQTKSKAAPHNAAVLSFMKLSGTMPAKLDAETVNHLQAALRSHIGDGIPSGTSTKSKSSLDDNPGKNKDSLKKTLAAAKARIKESTGMSPELQEAVFDSIDKATSQVIAHKLCEMIAASPELTLLASEPQIEAAEFLATTINSLEESLSIVLVENRMLAEQQRQRHATRLQEDVMYGHQQKAARQRRSSSRLEADLYEPDSDNVFIMNESHQERLSPNMSRYLAALESSTRADSHQIDTKSAAYLTETFEVTK